MKNTKKHQQSRDMLLDTCMKFSEKSFEFEEKREQSLINQSSLMITAFSFLSVAVLMVVPILIEYTNVKKGDIFICLVFILLLLLASMLTALFVQWRWKYQTLPSPMEIYNHCIGHKEEFSNKKYNIPNMINTLNSVYQSKKKINDKRVKLITISISLFILSIMCIVISFMVLK